jgi:4-amino-4-deoxy-L-arabinose transferase-like glycosyltransferase
MNVTSDETPDPGGPGPAGAPIGRADWLTIAAIAAAWAAMAILIDPAGDFPLNDDWAYGLPVKWLVEDGRLRVTDWGAMTLVAHVLLGSLFAGIGGFSFTALRVSTLAIAPVGLASTYLAGREVGLPRWLATAMAALFLANPIFIALSQTFMTDVFFWSLMMLAIFLLVRGVRRGRSASYWAGWAAVLAAALVRQLALAIPIGLVVGLALRDGFGRSWLVRVVLPAAAIFAVVAAYPRVAAATIGLSASYARTQDSLRQVFDGVIHLRLGALKPLVHGLGRGAMHLGWWMLPLLVLLPPARRPDDGPGKGVVTPLAAAGIAAALTAILWATGSLMPLGSAGSILVDFGTGPRTLGGGRAAHAPPAFWVAFTALSAFGTATILLILASSARRGLARLIATRDPRPLWLPASLVVAGMVYCIPFGYYGPWFDRYMLPEMGLMVLLLASVAAAPVGGIRRPSAPRLALSVVLALAYLGFGVASAHDYLAWNRARWQAARSLLASGDVTPREIEGGFEFDKYYSYLDGPSGPQGVGEAYPEPGAPGGDPPGSRRFVLAFGELPGRTVVRRLPVGRWMSASPEQVVILEQGPP